MHGFFSLASANVVSVNGINDILHELCPFHASISIDVNLLEKLEAAVHKLVPLFVVICIDAV